jgi:DNA-binding MarR family transcriptional regulator
MLTNVNAVREVTELRHAVMRLARRLRQEGGGQGSITASQLATLATVDTQGPMTLGELATAERVKPPSITRVVVTLERDGLVTRSTDPADGRVSLVAVTKAGRALLAQHRRRRDEWLDAALAGLSGEERAELMRVAPLLERLARS